MKREAHLQGILHISQKPHLSVKEPSLKVLFMESLAERCPTTRALLHSPIKVPDIPAPSPHIPGSHWMGRGPHGERRSYPETFLTYLPGSPVKELSPQAPSAEPLQRETFRCTVIGKANNYPYCLQYFTSNPLPVTHNNYKFHETCHNLIERK